MIKSFFRNTVMTLLVSVLLVSVASTTVHGDDSKNVVSFNMATYNIFYYTPPEHADSWQQRRDHVANIVRFHDISLWGTQEGMHNQLQDLTGMLGHQYIGVARDDGDTEGEHSAIFYDPDRFEALNEGTFWLSKTPDRPSMDWGVNFHRICTWGEFKHLETGKTFYVYNAHFDHESQLARDNSSRMVLEYITEHVPDDRPVVFMGDVNAPPGNTAYEKLADYPRLNDAKNVSDTPALGPPGTFNGFDINRNPDRRIDYLFLSDHFDVHRYAVLTHTYLFEEGLRFPSDHFPVMIETTLRF